MRFEFEPSPAVIVFSTTDPKEFVDVGVLHARIPESTISRWPPCDGKQYEVQLSIPLPAILNKLLGK